MNRTRRTNVGPLITAWGILLLGGCVSSVAQRSVRPLDAGQWGGGVSVWYPVMMSGYLRGAFTDWLEVEAAVNAPEPTVESGFRIHVARSDRAALRTIVGRDPTVRDDHRGVSGSGGVRRRPRGTNGERAAETTIGFPHVDE